MPLYRIAVEVNADSGGDGGAVDLVSIVAEQREFDYFVLAVKGGTNEGVKDALVKYIRRTVIPQLLKV
ncbi:hypothetical protein HanPI659440_Chr09g0338521 [Helianthus annuus]|nr:hypothetical protein HanPI659440_Chr09g0338521 [Helianthus annuus]